MKHQDFINKYLGKKIDWDGVYGYQCKDLAKAYCKEVLGFDLARGNAWEVCEEKYAPFGNNWVKGSVSEGLQQGDIIFSKPAKTNIYGHIAIAHSSTEMLEQNGGKGSGTGIGVDAIRIIPLKQDICCFWRMKGVSNSMWSVYLQENGKEYVKTIGTRNLCIQDPDNFLQCSEKDFRIKVLIGLERSYKQ